MIKDALYYRDSYLREFDGVIIDKKRVDNHYEIVLDKTCFYPTGGGQECDLGTLNGVEVYDVKEVNDRVVHYTREDISGDVHGIINWKRRFSLMQQHSGEHIVSGIIHREFGYNNIGFHMGSLIEIDYDGYLDDEDIRNIEIEANKVIYEDKDVVCEFFDDVNGLEYRSKKELDGIVRIVRIDGVDVCACCGTHVRHTGEIGLIRFFGIDHHKNKTRIYMQAGKEALKLDISIYDENRRVMKLLSSEMNDISNNVERLLNKNGELESELRNFRFESLIKKCDEFDDDLPLVIVEEKDIDIKMGQKACNYLIDDKRADVGMVVIEKSDGCDYVMASRCLALRPIGNKLNELLNGRGGGSDEMIQGHFNCDKFQILEKVKELVKM